MRDGCNNFIDAENNFILHSHTLPKPRKELKNKMNLKVDSNYTESTHGKIKKDKEQIAGLIESLKDYRWRNTW